MIREINYRNGRDCGSGFDVFLYVDSDSDAAAAMVKHLPTKREVYVDLTGTDDPEQSCYHFANGCAPLDSEDGAESVWDEMHAEFQKQST